jgi:hypothetical protein
MSHVFWTTDFMWKNEGLSLLKDIENNSLNSLEAVFQRAALYIILFSTEYFSSLCGPWNSGRSFPASGSFVEPR